MPSTRSSSPYSGRFEPAASSPVARASRPLFASSLRALRLCASLSCLLLLPLIAHAYPVALPSGSSVGTVSDLEAAVLDAASTAQTATQQAAQVAADLGALPTQTWDQAAVDAAAATGQAAQVAASLAALPTQTWDQAAADAQAATGQAAQVAASLAALPTGAWARADASNAWSAAQTIPEVRLDSMWRKTVVEEPGSEVVTTGVVLYLTADLESPPTDLSITGAYYQSEDTHLGWPVLRHMTPDSPWMITFDGASDWRCHSNLSAGATFINLGYPLGDGIWTLDGADPAEIVNSTQGNTPWIRVVVESTTPEVTAGFWFAPVSDAIYGFTNAISASGGGYPSLELQLGSWKYYLDAETYVCQGPAGEYVLAEYTTEGGYTGNTIVTNHSVWTLTNEIPGTVSTNWIELTGPTTNVAVSGYEFILTNGWIHAIREAE